MQAYSAWSIRRRVGSRYFADGFYEFGEAAALFATAVLWLLIGDTPTPAIYILLTLPTFTNKAIAAVRRRVVEPRTGYFKTDRTMGYQPENPLIQAAMLAITVVLLGLIVWLLFNFGWLRDLLLSDSQWPLWWVVGWRVFELLLPLLFRVPAPRNMLLIVFSVAAGLVVVAAQITPLFNALIAYVLLSGMLFLLTGTVGLLRFLHDHPIEEVHYDPAQS